MKTILTAALITMFYSLSHGQVLVFDLFAKEEFEVSEKDLHDMNTLPDLHPRYNKEWVDTYISTELTYTFQNDMMKATGSNEDLTAQQKELLLNAKPGSTIDLVVHYMPKNNLAQNDPQKMDLQIKIIPEKTPIFVGGNEQFQNYIYNNLIEKLSDKEKETIQFSVVQFDIASNGDSDHVEVQESTGNLELDAKIAQVLCNMPAWEPATKSDGEKMDYSMKFYITNVKQSCRVNEIVARKESTSK